MKVLFQKYSKNCSNKELDVSDVIDFTNLKNKNISVKITKKEITKKEIKNWEHLINLENLDKNYLNLFNDISEWDIFTIDNYEGFYVIKNCLKTITQYYLILRALTTYCQDPYWNNYNNHKYKINDTILNGNIWELSKNKNDLEIFDLAKNYLRWSQLGYLFHHDTHKYDLEPNIPLCPELKSIAKIISQFVQIENCETFNPDMALVNYYAGFGDNVSKKKTTSLRPHTDTYELTMEYPIVTISIGLPAIFLVANNDSNQSPLCNFYET